MPYADPFVNATGVLPRTRLSVIAGGAAGNHTLTGIAANDKIVEVIRLAGANVATGFAAGAYTMDADDATANSATIPTGLTAPDTFQVMILDSGGNVVTSDADVTVSGANLIVADGVTFNVTDGYVVHWFAYDATDAVLGNSLTATDLTSEFSATAANTINNTGGTATTGDLLLVRWYDLDRGELTAAV